MPDDPERTVVSQAEPNDDNRAVIVPLPGGAKVPGPGVTVGGFRITGRLGRGGMGEVYLARQISMDRDVALKILSSSMAADADLIKRFLHEVHVAAKLDHPHIVTAYEAGQDGGLYYMAMAYVKGETLGERIKRRKLDEREALVVTRAVAEALAYAWQEHRMLHRDIKPANVMLDVHGNAKLMDMGLSKIVTVESGLTMTNAIMGTPNYMSPEQAQAAKDIDTRADMYSLGATLYHMVTGRLPFKGSTVVETLRKQVLEELPHPCDLVPELSAACGELIRIMMAKDRTRRHATWASLLVDFDRVLRGEFPKREVPPTGGSVIMSSMGAHASPVGVVVAGRRPGTGRSRIWMTAAVAIVLSGVGGGLWYLGAHEKRGAPPLPHAMPIPPRVPPTARSSVLPAYRALVIGVSDYAPHDGEGWATLRTARADAESVGLVLEDKYGFTVTRLLDAQATRAAIMAELDKLVTLGSDDAAVVYFAGHGYYDEKLGEGYWIPRNARKRVGDRMAKEDWLWNSTITKVLGASTARHILVIADSCYAGTLLRGETPGERELDIDWYRQAILRPSRFVIASGDLEPVLDSGVRHSVFGQEVLNYLEHSGRSVFSASDLGQAAKKKVAALTGQMVQMAPLVSAGHAGGEFVFVDPAVGEEFAKEMPPATIDTGRQEGAPPPATGIENSPRSSERQLRDILSLAQSGATNAANRLVASMLKSHGDARLVKAVADYLDSERRSKARDRLSRLIEHLAERKAKLEAEGVAQADESLPRPRVVACLGPEASGNANEGMGLLYRICLRTELDKTGGLVVVEREAIEEVLKEMDIGSSSLADARAELTVGKLLPAGMLLAGNLITIGDEDQLYLRLIDTETTIILGSFKASRLPDEDIEKTCAVLATNIVNKAVKLKPVSAPLTHIESTRAQAAVGIFHGLHENSRFDIVLSDAEAGKRVVGGAKVVSLTEMSSDFKLVFTEEHPPAADAGKLWIRERAGED